MSRSATKPVTNAADQHGALVGGLLIFELMRPHLILKIEHLNLFDLFSIEHLLFGFGGNFEVSVRFYRIFFS